MGSASAVPVGTPAGLVLAAGAGSRLGRGPKALLRYGGELLVERAVGLLGGAGCQPVLVVLGAGADRVRSVARLPPGTVLVENPEWPSGMASSLRAGVAAVPPTAGAVVVTLVDTPLLGPAAVDRLAAAWRAGADAAVATYRGVPGHPVLVSAAVLPDVVAAAHGDRGARTWLRRNPDRVVPVPCDGTGDPLDIDCVADLAHLG